jgi:hypothetical protein
MTKENLMTRISAEGPIGLYHSMKNNVLQLMVADDTFIDTKSIGTLTIDK